MSKIDNRLILWIRGRGNVIICCVDKTLTTKEIREALVIGLEAQQK